MLASRSNGLGCLAGSSIAEKSIARKNCPITAFGLIMALGLTLCCIGSSLAWAGVASVILFVLYLVWVVCRAPHQLVKYFAFYFSASINILGCAICEYTVVYLNEMHVYTEFVGSLPLIVLSRWVFLIALSMFDRRFGVEGELANVASARGFVDILTWIILAVEVILFASVAANPSFLLGVDRFAYANGYLSGFFFRPFEWLGFLILFPILSVKNSRSKAGVAAIALYVLCAIWVGNKFGVFFSLLSVAVLANYDNIFKLGRERLAHACMRLGLALVLLVGASLALQGTISNVSSDEYLFQRAAQQGQLWWKTYEISNGEAHLDQFDQEIAGISAPTGVSDNVGSNYGIYGIMYLVAPKQVVDANLSRGARYTEAAYATAYYCFGAVGPIMFSLAMAFFISLGTNAMLRAVAEGRLIDAILLLRVTNALNAVLGMATFNVLFGRGMLLSVAFLVLMWLIRLDGKLHGAVVTRPRHYVVRPDCEVLPFCNLWGNGLLNRPIHKLLLDSEPGFKSSILKG